MANLSDKEFLEKFYANTLTPADAGVSVAPGETPPTQEAPPPGENPPATDTPPADPPATDDQPPATDTPVNDPPAMDTPPATDDTPPAGAPPATDDAAPLDYKALYEKALQPFKADGKMVQVSSVDELVTLAQKGIHYNRKMRDLKPQRELYNILQKNNLTDPEKIGFLVDLANKDKGAIHRLLAEANIDPVELLATKDTPVEYKPKDHRNDPQTQALLEVVEEVIETDHGKTVWDDALTWDGESKAQLMQTPAILTGLTQQKADGTYDAITSEISKRKALGTLHASSFLQAYLLVGNELKEQNKLPWQAKQPAPPAAKTPPTPPATPPVAKVVVPPAPPARIPGQNPGGTAPKTTDSIEAAKGMTDAEFMAKYFPKRK